jgi:hypothetical protein
MAISFVSSTTISSYQPNSQQSSFAQTLQQLVKSIRSGDLAGAQQAYAALSQAQGGQNQSDPNNPLAQALSQIGQALQSNNISGAQQALLALQQQAQSAPGSQHHHHRRHAGGAAPGGASNANAPTDANSTSDGTSSTSTLNIVA